MSDLTISKMKVLDPRILQQEPSYQIQQGSGSVSYNRYAPTSASTNSLAYNVNPPTEEMITDRILKYDGDFDLKTTVSIVARNAAGGNIDLPTAEAYKGQPVVMFGLNSTLTDHPLNKVFDNTQIQINNASINNRSGDNFDMLKWMMNNPKDGLQKGTPSRLEIYQNYSGSAVFPNSNIQGIGQANTCEAPPNGSFEGIRFCDPAGNVLRDDGTYVSDNRTVAYRNGVPVTCTDDGAVTGTGELSATYDIYVKVSVVERAFISPFIFNESHDGQTGLYGIRQLNISHNLRAPSNLIKIDKRSAIHTEAAESLYLNTMSTSFNNVNPWQNMRLVMTFRTPSIYESPPKINIVPYNEYQTNKTTRVVNLGAGGKTRIRSDAVIPASIPNLMLICVRPSSYAVDESDWFISPESLSIKFGSHTNLMTDASKQDLYEMSYKNGVEMTRAMWYGSAYQNGVSYNDPSYTTSKGAGFVPLVGGFVALVPGVDFPLKEDHAGGLGVNMTFDVDIEIENRLNVPLPSVDIITVFVNSGFISSADGSSAINLQPITSQEIVNAPVDMDALVGNVMVGGSFWGKVGSFLKKKVWQPVKKLAENKQVRQFVKDGLRRTGNKYATTAADIADQVGLGVRTGGAKRQGLLDLYK